MSEARIGRVLVASLHQSIADLLPTRLEFYENWLNVAGLREGTIGLAPLTAVLSFLRTEGHAYNLITARAGEYAAAWTFENVPALKVRIVRALPAGLRARAALGTARALVSATYPGSRAVTKIKDGVVTVDIRGSLFCEVREASVEPLCGFYASAIARVLQLFDVSAEARVNECRAVGRAPRLRRGGDPGNGARERQRGRRMITALLCALVSLSPPTQVQRRRPRRSRRRRRRRRGRPRILVVPFETPGRDGRTYWLGEAVAVLIADDINARGLGAITRPSRERAYDQLHLPPNAVLSRATVIKVGEIVGAGAGDRRRGRRRRRRADRARAADPDRRRPRRRRGQRARQARGPVCAGPEGGAPGRPRRERRRQRPGSVAAGVRAIRQGPAGGAARDPGGVPRSGAQAGSGVRPRPAGAVGSAHGAGGPRGGPRGGARGRCLVARCQARAVPRRRLADVAEAVRRGVHRSSRACRTRRPNPAILNNLGVIQLRRSGPADAGKPAYYFTKAAEAEPDDPDVLFNLGYAYALDRDPQGAIYWLREALRRRPADGDAHIVLASALDAAGSTVEAGRERELAAQLSPRPAEGRREALPRGLERVRTHLESLRGSGIDQAITNTAQRDQRDLAQFHLERGRRLFETEQDREAMMELRRAVFLSPYEAEAHLLIGRIHLRGGRPREAVDALKISIWSRDTAAAQVAMADAYLRLKDVPAARAHVQKALALDPDVGRSEGAAESNR